MKIIKAWANGYKAPFGGAQIDTGKAMLIVKVKGKRPEGCDLLIDWHGREIDVSSTPEGLDWAWSENYDLEVRAGAGIKEIEKATLDAIAYVKENPPMPPASDDDTPPYPWGSWFRDDDD